VAHELRTPLAAIRSYIEAMLDGVWTFDQERLKSCHEELMRLTRMIKDIEKLSKYEGEITLNKKQFNLHEVAQQIVANFEHEYENKGIELTFHAEYTEIVADQDKLSQVIINLLSNALKYTNEGGSVKLTISKFNHFVEITVTDTGIGISEDDLPHVFERFYRADKSRTRSTGGSGIGLTITRAIVKAHGGKIKIESTVGVGTKVNVILPKVHIY
jgi:two-component system sensor histidine kinase BaeS